MASSSASAPFSESDRRPNSDLKHGGRKQKNNSRRRRRRRRNRKPKRNWLELPRDVTASILQKVGSVDLLQNVQKVCTTWWKICQESSMWRKIDMRVMGLDDLFSLENMCRNAVNRSQGQLVDITIEYFGTDELLQYISDRSNQLKRLRLVHCHGVSGEGLSEAVKKLPLLEELHLACTSVEKEAIETVGRCCPLLKALKLNDQKCGMGSMDSDEVARAIAENMPELRHLQLLGNRLTNVGLEAILDGCHNLESLDLRLCFNLSLKGDLGKRCSEQIKDLRRPHDSIRDSEYDTEVHFWDPFEEDFDEYLSGFSDLDLYDYEYDDFCDISRYNSDFSEYDGMPW